MSVGRLRLAAGAMPCIALLAAGCVSTPDCGALGPGSIAALQCRAEGGDKTAQLDLGIRYDEGLGVPADPRRAASLYRAAAAFTPGTIFVYAPPVGDSPGTVIPVSVGLDQPGLYEARYRLALLFLDGASQPGTGLSHASQSVGPGP